MLFLLLLCSLNISYASKVESNGASLLADKIALSSQPHISRFSFWAKIPNIKICNSSPASKDQVISAMQWWSKRGFKFGTIKYSNCISQKHPGFIVISLVGQGFDFSKSLGTTNVHHDKVTKEIYWSQIYIPDALKIRVLEHEIGHALGWSHSTIRGHLMYPTWQLGGWDDSGIKESLTRP
jgi:hypothetical protein